MDEVSDQMSSLVLHKYIYWGYSLELSCQGNSNVILQNMFLWKNKIISIFGVKSCILSGAMGTTAFINKYFYSIHTCIYPKYFNREARANSADPDQTLQNAAANQSLPILPLIKKCSDLLEGSKMDLSKFKDKYGKEFRCPHIYGKYGIYICCN